MSRRLLCSLVVLLSSSLPHASDAQVIAVDEFDGKVRSGFREEGLGEWAKVPGAKEVDGAFVTQHGNHFRALAQPVSGGTVWYALTLKTHEPIKGYVSVTPTVDAQQQFCEYGFNSHFGDTRGVWTNAPSIVKTHWPSTELQTLVVRIDFDLQRWSGFAAKSYGEELIDERGQLAAVPLFHDAPLQARSLSHIYLSKGGATVVEVHRLSLARTIAEALGLKSGTGKTRELSHEPKPVAAAARKLPPHVETLVGPDSPLAVGERISFFGDSITWQGGHIDDLSKALKQRRPDLKVELFKRGINGGKSTDLRDGCENLYGSTQKPLREVVKTDRSTVVVISIGINDVWHQESGKGNSPQQYREALQSLVSDAKQAGATVIVATPSIIGEKPRGQNKFDKQLDEYSAIALDVAQTEKVVGCDLRSAFIRELDARRTGAATEKLLTYDGVHMLPAGNDLIADELAKALIGARMKAVEK